ncbi:MAG: polyhydroxyalkanoic acid system family protein [Porphyrobacter sp.]|nr:polyhydroxyalkanoic acid system family protein [Porphyrobacter sp.]
MQVAIPHSLGRDEARRRLKTRSHTIAEAIPGGMAQVATEWPSEDRMTLSITAMGQTVAGHVEVEADQVVFLVTLPPILEFLEPLVAGAIRQQGQHLLAAPEPPSKG